MGEKADLATVEVYEKSEQFKEVPLKKKKKKRRKIESPSLDKTKGGSQNKNKPVKKGRQKN